MTADTKAILQIVGIIAAMVAMLLVMRWRRRTHGEFIAQYAQDEVCEHLRSALELLRSRGHMVVRAGQHHPEAPLEIHLAPGFDPKAVYDELKLAEPVRVSERNVLFCFDDACELHPPKG